MLDNIARVRQGEGGWGWPDDVIHPDPLPAGDAERGHRRNVQCTEIAAILDHPNTTRDAMTVTRERLPEVLSLATTVLLRHFSMGGGSHGWSSDRVRSRLGADRAMMTDADK